MVKLINLSDTQCFKKKKKIRTNQVRTGNIALNAKKDNVSSLFRGGTYQIKNLLQSCHRFYAI